MKQNQAEAYMKINEVEQIVGITKRNIRFYEKQGLLLPCRNSANGYRDYTDEDIAALKKIKLLRKLAVPIDEIHKMQTGMLTATDALKRHLIKLERESKNIDMLKKLCSVMSAEDKNLDTLDPDVYLEKMARMEKEGIKFMNIKNKDQKKMMVSSVMAAGVFIAFMAALLGLLLFAFLSEGDVPLVVMVLILVFPAVAIIGVALALKQRMKEIKEGEENAAAQY